MHLQLLQDVLGPLQARAAVGEGAEPAGLSRPVVLVAKNEFGDVLIDEEELWMLADYIVRLEDVIRGEAGIFMRFRLKYLLGLMD